MQPSDYDDLLARFRQLSTVFGTIYRDVTGEDFDLEGAVRHYPLVSLGLAAGAGLLGGIWLARRPRAQLPPPPPPAPLKPFDYLEQLLPQPFERVRRALPEMTSEDASAIARTWLESVIEPGLKDTMESSKFGLFLRRTLERLDDGGKPTE